MMLLCSVAYIAREEGRTAPGGNQDMGRQKGRQKLGGDNPMSTERCINVVSWVKYGRDAGDVIHNVVSTSIIRRRNITEYSTSSKRRDLERIRRHCRQSNATSIGSRNDVVG